MDLLKDDRCPNKLPESDRGEGSEGSTEVTRYSKQNTNVRNDNNIQHNYKKSYNNTSKSNNIITQMDNEKSIPSQEPSQPSPSSDVELSRDKQSIVH